MAELTVPTVDFSTLGNLGNDWRKGVAENQTRMALSQLGKRPDGTIDTAPLYASGNLSLAQLGTQIDNEAATRARQSKQDERQLSRDSVDDKFRNESLNLQRRAAARADADKPIFKEVTDASGNTQIIRIMPQAGTASTVNTGITPTVPANPFAVGPKLNTDQSKSATMTDRMADANGVISKNENINDGVFGKPMGIAQAIPFVRDSALFNAVASPERQQVVQAQRNFVNAILRVESGAAISEGEFNNAQRQYFPQVGDSKEVIEQKRQNRVTAMKGMAREAGPNYRPPESLTSIPAGATKPPAASNPQDPLGIR